MRGGIEPMADPQAKIGEVTYGHYTFPLLAGQGSTFFKVEALKDEPEGLIVEAYAAATGDARWDVDVKAAYKALAYVIIRDWYEARKLPIPSHIQARIDQACIDAQVSTASETGKTKMSFREFLTKCFRLDRPEDDILAETAVIYPHIREERRRSALTYWRNRLAKEERYA